MKIKTIDIVPLKMGRVKSTNKIRAIECKLNIIWDNGHKTYNHINTYESGIFGAYLIAQEMISKNIKEGVV